MKKFFTYRGGPYTPKTRQRYLKRYRRNLKKRYR